MVERDGVAVVAGCLARVREELLVVGCFVFLVEASGETKVGELDVTASVEEDVVGFDITMQMSILKLSSCHNVYRTDE